MVFGAWSTYDMGHETPKHHHSVRSIYASCLLKFLALSLIEWILTAEQEEKLKILTLVEWGLIYTHTLVERHTNHQLLVDIALHKRIIRLEDISNIVLFLLIECINLVGSYVICQINVSGNAIVASTAAAAGSFAGNCGVMGLYVSFHFSDVCTLDFCDFLSSFVEMKSGPVQRIIIREIFFHILSNICCHVHSSYFACCCD